MKNGLIGRKSTQLSLPGFQAKPNGLIANKTLTLEQWGNAGDLLGSIEGSLSWYIGDWINAKRDKWEQGSLAEICEEHGLAYTTASNAATVCNAFDFNLRRLNLSFGHHKEVQGRDDAEELLDWCEETKPPRPIKELRAEKVRRQREEKQSIELPRGTFNILYADPPWSYGDERTSDNAPTGGAKCQYDLMSLDEICDMEIPSMADDSALFLWATVPLLGEGLDVIDAWGFEYKTQIVWDKVNPYFGNYTQVQHEILMLGTRGSFVPTGDQPRSIIAEKKEGHSAKPDSFYTLIESMYPLAKKRIELFARRRRNGWKQWGNEL